MNKYFLSSYATPAYTIPYWYHERSEETDSSFLMLEGTINTYEAHKYVYNIRWLAYSSTCTVPLC